MANKVKLGHNIYMWTPTGGVGQRVVVSCHGGFNGGSFQSRRGTSYLFYSLPTQSAYGSLEKVLHPDQVKDRTDCGHEKESWNMVEDYDLSKFQGKHGGDSESYGDIKTFVDGYGLSVVSIRHRTGKHERANDDPITLRIVYQLIEGSYPNTVNEYQCLFCRVDSTGTSQYKNAFTGQAYSV